MKKKIVKIDTTAVLKHRYCDIEWHLKSDNSFFPLNFFQVLLYKILGFDYIYGEKYLDYIINQFKNKNARRKH